jgi:hypothetical protein
MKKDEVIKRYGKAAWEKKLEQRRARYKAHPLEEKARNNKYREEHKEEANAATRKWREEHPEQVLENNKRSSQEKCRTNGKYYDKKLVYKRTGIPGDKNRIRNKHNKQYHPYKDIIAQDSQIHHEWIPPTDEYRGVALVEADAHMHGFVDVIAILDGEITVLTEEQIANGGV